MTADEAHALGIVTRVVDGDDLLEQAWDLSIRLAQGPAHALGQARTLIRSGYAAGFYTHLDREAEAIARMAATEETGALISAFLKPKA